LFENPQVASIALWSFYGHTLFHGLSDNSIERPFSAFGHGRECKTLPQQRNTITPLAFYETRQPSWRTFGWPSNNGRIVYVHGACVVNGRCCLVAQEQKDAEKPFKGEH